jgi:Zn-dependent protease
MKPTIMDPQPPFPPSLPVPVASGAPAAAAGTQPPPLRIGAPGPAGDGPFGESGERPFGEFGLGDDQPSRQSWLRQKLGAAGAATLALLAKIKTILIFLPKGIATVGTMAVSIVAYGSIWGFAFGAGFVALLLVHEMGHVIQLRREGVKASVPIFIPFLGAVIGSRSLGDNAFAEAKVGLAGPILGSIGSAACILIWHATGNDLWRALAYTGFLINLFNLIPVVPLDGGRAMAAMSPQLWVVGFVGLVVLAFVDPNPIFVLILLVGAFEIYRRWKQRRQGGAEAEAYYKVPAIDRILIGAVYVSLIALLAVGMHATNLPRTL